MHLAKYGEFIICGGTIISPNYVMTAAHCTRKVKANEVRFSAGHLKWFGASNEPGYQSRTVQQIISHPGAY
jgi:V8-like Glu-specific endopeptidase